MFKEELRPKAADRVPVRAGADHLGDRARSPPSPSSRSAPRRRSFGWLPSALRLQVADVNVAVLVVFAIASMSVYGIVLAGWSSNSKYSLLGGLRSSAQMISYELSYGLALASVLIIGNSLSLTRHRERAGGHRGSDVIPRWFVFLQPIGFRRST